MKSFLITCFYFVIPVLLALGAIGFLADGRTDPYYLKFASPRQGSLVLGISRAGQGLRPDIIDSTLGRQYPHAPLYNFSFTLYGSPYGKVYLDAIRRKLRPGTRNGIFIVTVEPFTLACLGFESPDEQGFRENTGMLATTQWMSTYPNFLYLANNYPKAYTCILTTRIENHYSQDDTGWQLHKNGWFEVNPPMDSTSVAARIKATEAAYAAYLPHTTVSPVRKAYLVKTIDFLREHGDVYMVRMPMYPGVSYYSERLYPGFDRFIDSIARPRGIPYLNFIDSNARYSYTDGSHLSKASGALVSAQLAQMILEHRQGR